MSVNISISNKENNGCNKIINIMIECGIDGRLIDTFSIIDNGFEKGCLITLDKNFINKNSLTYFWNKIKMDYTCAHLDINGHYNGCILDYLYKDNCPGSYKKNK